MLIEHAIPLYAKESQALLYTPKVGKKNPTSLFELALRKLGKLLTRTKQNEIYPLCALFTIHKAIEETREGFSKATVHYQTLLADKSVKLSDFNFEVRCQLKIIFGNPIIFNLAQLGRQFDELMRLVTLAKHTGVLEQRAFFREKEQHWDKMKKVLLDITGINIEVMPPITVESYLNEEGGKDSESIDMAVLHTALKLPFLPYTDTEKLMGYQRALREKARGS